MKRIATRLPFLLLSLLFLQPLFGSSTETEKLYYGFEMNGTLIGYAETTLTPPAAEGEPRLLTTILFAKMTLLDQDFDLRVEEHYAIDSESGMVLQQESKTEMGTMLIDVKTVRKGDEAHFSSASGPDKVVSLEGGVILEDAVYLTHLLRALPTEGATATLRTYDYNSGEVRTASYERKADTTFELVGEQIPCAACTVVDEETGISSEFLLDLANGMALRVTLPNEIVIYRAAAGVVGKIKRAELDDLLLALADVAIADFQSISYMKIEATLETVGEIVTVESLNVPGQKFTGTVEGSIVKGVFEIAHSRYDGAQAPPFPPEFGEDPALAEFLEREQLIEADDPVLVAHARELTTGASDSWDAAVRLSKWVGKEIVYEIPGGSARTTFDARKGECGSHSRLLVAFCRAVGVPARLACGGMYVPNYGGTFGQHAWTEVYMGEKAGWIPIDSTTNEFDFVDSGHIRLGSNASFMPKTLKVLEYKVPSMEGGREATLGSFAETPWKTGETYVYEYTLDGQPLGTDSFTVESVEETGGRTIITCHTSLDLTGRKVEGTIRLDGAGHPISFTSKGQAGAVEYTIDCAFTAGQVIEKATQGAQKFDKTVELPEEVYLLETNNFGGYALLLPAVPREAGAKLSFKVFLPSRMQLFPVQIRVGEVETIEVGGRQRQGRRNDLNIAGTPLTVWVDEEGRILREEEAGGRMVVELRPSDAD